MITGEGTPLVLVPGIQGRWEFMRATVDALAGAFRVITFSLCGDRASGRRFDPALGMDNYVAQIAAALDEAREPRAVICGVSFGALAALHFAAQQPERTTALILASAPGPRWHLKPRHRFYARQPLIFGPLFMAEAPLRLWKEIATALPARADRGRFTSAQLRTLFSAPISLRRMGERATLIASSDRLVDCARVTAPTLVVTGETGLDHVVPVGGSSEYVDLIRGARAVTLEGTGHLGTVTRADRFARVVEDFVRNAADAAA